jgi:4-alpha-glucanotransferase
VHGDRRRSGYRAGGDCQQARDSGVYSYKVLYFENDHEKTFRAPKAYPEQSMAVATTHDLPTLAATGKAAI